MAWIQVGTKKINTAVVNYIEQTDDNLKIHFNSGGEVDLAGAEAAGFWKVLKAENALAFRDAGSTTTLPKYSNSSSAPKPTAAPSVTIPKPGVHSSSSSHSGSHSHSSHSQSSGSIGLKKH